MVIQVQEWINPLMQEFRQEEQPEVFDRGNEQHRENCLAARSLFSSFCSSPLCLQTQVLPYLAMLTNPLRNPYLFFYSTNCIYSRCCRLPLKRQFARLKLETLTDKDPGLLNAESGEEDNLTEMQRERNDTANSMGNAKELLSTQGAESVLPASQPQPVAAQAVMEDEELKIEEYDSD
ncbi:hypothetical protein XELAEV_18010859mg [Xenopus laevis]|uniref:Uncharacterized protein n=1 Tax=Xenopus laevis TaxID=8355 RepID=A0A974DVC4_XENLA|nr:hypothetical protein XELAEV_18010859mg [Xenopus laevis]